MEYKGNHRRTFEETKKSRSLTKHSPDVLTLFAGIALPVSCALWAIVIQSVWGNLPDNAGITRSNPGACCYGPEN
jgi:hypothetical protein